MKRRILKKSEVLREGYMQGLKKAHSVIKRMLSENTEAAPLYRGEIYSVLRTDWNDEDGAGNDCRDMTDYYEGNFTFSDSETFMTELSKVLGIDEVPLYYLPNIFDADEGIVSTNWIGDKEMEIDEDGEWLWDVQVRCTVLPQEPRPLNINELNRMFKPYE